MSAQQAIAFAPATVANVAVGFDLLGHSIRGLGDRVTANTANDAGVRIREIRGIGSGALPTNPNQNTASAAVQALLAEQQCDFGVELTIDKGIPLSSGLGGSAASAVAALVAVNALLPEPLDAEALYPFALSGEAVASGAAHGDNVGPALLGGLVMATADRARKLPVPAGLWCAVAHPDMCLETKRAREVLLPPFELELVVKQQANLALVLAGLHCGDLDTIAEGLRDALIEPRRAFLIPGFDDVKRAALDHGALGASISGGGPSVFAWFRDEDAGSSGGEAMRRAFEATDMPARLFVSPVAGPAARVEQAR